MGALGLAEGDFMKPSKYLVQTLGLFGPQNYFGNDLKKLIKKARIEYRERDEFMILAVRDGGIVRIKKNGRT